MKPFEKVRSSEMKLVDLLHRIKSVNDYFLYWNNVITKFSLVSLLSKPSANASFNSGRGVKKPIEALATPSAKPVTKGRMALNKPVRHTKMSFWVSAN